MCKTDTIFLTVMAICNGKLKKKKKYGTAYQVSPPPKKKKLSRKMDPNTEYFSINSISGWNYQDFKAAVSRNKRDTPNDKKTKNAYVNTLTSKKK